MYPGREESRRVVISVSGGLGNTDIVKIWSLCRRFRVIPPNETTTYTFTIKDGDGDLILRRGPVTGTYSESDVLQLGIASNVSITSASTDGSFIVKLDMH